jgi:hypothetical protein
LHFYAFFLSGAKIACRFQTLFALSAESKVGILGTSILIFQKKLVSNCRKEHFYKPMGVKLDAFC